MMSSEKNNNTKEQPHKSRREIIKLLAILAIGKLFVLLCTFLYHHSFNFIYTMSTTWDSTYYQLIATSGYTRMIQYVFSPIYPGLIETLDIIIPRAWVSALIITNIISFIFPLVVYKTFGYKTALIAILFPTYLVFTTIPYSDIVPLIFFALSVFFMLKEKIIESSIAAGLAVLSAFHAVWMLPAYAVDTIKTKRFKNLVFYIAPAAAGILVLLWFKIKTDNFMAYFSLETEGWREHFGTPFSQAKWLINGWFTNESWKIFGMHLAPAYWLVRNLIFEIFYLAGAVLILKTQNKHRIFLFVYSLCAIIPLLFVTGTPAISIPRLLLPAFPVFFGYTALMEKDWHYRVYGGVCLLITAWIAITQTYCFFA